MIKKASEFKTEYRENMRGGNGVVEITNFVTPAELNDKGRLFANITLRPGCSIGYHVHENDSEIFYLMKGEALYNDNGVDHILTAVPQVVELLRNMSPVWRDLQTGKREYIL